MSKHIFFVTGTDTGVGKTCTACGLLNAARKRGLSTLGLKPIASGCDRVDGRWRNGDALALQASATLKLDYDDVNPLALPEAIAPHLAAQHLGIALSVQVMREHYRRLEHGFPDFTVIEGAGGWLVPLNATETVADFVKLINVPVVLVVGIRLGCINHALLTAQSIAASGLRLAAWIANSMDNNTVVEDEIIATLKHFIRAPCVGRIPFTDQQDFSAWIDLQDLLN